MRLVLGFIFLAIAIVVGWTMTKVWSYEWYLIGAVLLIASAFMFWGAWSQHREEALWGKNKRRGNSDPDAFDGRIDLFPDD